MIASQVRPSVFSKMDVSARLVAAWARVIAKHGRGVFADKLGADAANDMETVADLSHLVGAWVSALADGHRCHVETLALAKVIRPLLPRMNAICAETDFIRGVA